MIKKIIPNGQTVTFNISSNYEQNIPEKGATIFVADGDGIVVETGTHGDIFIVNGTLTAASEFESLDGHVFQNIWSQPNEICTQLCFISYEPA